MQYLLSFDLGTGGVKASLFGEDGRSVGEAFREYPTFYTPEGFQEQRPADWWEQIASACSELRQSCPAYAQTAAIGISGHSLGAIGVTVQGELVWERTPIWSDARAAKQAEDFFTHVPEREWYETTGNGFPAGQYPLFKLMWYREHDPLAYARPPAFLVPKITSTIFSPVFSPRIPRMRREAARTVWKRRRTANRFSVRRRSIRPFCRPYARPTRCLAR